MRPALLEPKTPKHPVSPAGVPWRSIDLGHQSILPSRWPFVVASVCILAALCGAWASWQAMPVGNLVTLHVVGERNVAAAVEATLVQELRSLKLDVGGPPDGRVAAAHVTITVEAAPHPTVPGAIEAHAQLHVDVVDDDAGGTASISATGIGPDETLGRQDAGRTLGWLLVGHVAGMLSPVRDGLATVRRITDGRGSTRVFARAWGAGAAQREEHVRALLQARARGDEASQRVSDSNVSSELLAVLPDGRAVLLEQPGHAIFIPSQRREPWVQPNLVRVRLEGDSTPLVEAVSVTHAGRSASGWPLLEATNGAGETCLMDLRAPSWTACLAPSSHSAHAPDAARVDSNRVLATISEGGNIPRDRLALVDGRTSEPVWLTNHVGSDAQPHWDHVHGAAVFTVRHPDPDGPGTFAEVRRVKVPASL